MLIAVSCSLKHTYFRMPLGTAMSYTREEPYDLSKHNHCSTLVLIWQILTDFYFYFLNARLEISPDSGVNRMGCALIH